MADPPEPNPSRQSSAADNRPSDERAPPDARALRAAAALRENLRKRKQQSRARAEQPRGEPARDAST